MDKKLPEDELYREYRNYYSDFDEEKNEDGEIVLRKEVDGKKIQAVDFEKWKEYKEKGILEKLESGIEKLNEGLEGK